jgi:hypothetical protein
VWVGGDRSAPVAPPKEPALSPRPRHRAAGTAPRGVLGDGSARHSQVNRSRILLLLAVVCAGLLIAAPIALFVSGGAEQNGSLGDDVFTTEDGGAGEGGTGRGGAAPITTESAQSPAPAGSTTDPGAVPVAGGNGGDAAGGAAAGAGAPAGSAGTGGSWTGSGPAPAGGGTAAGQPAPGGTAGGSTPAPANPGTPKPNTGTSPPAPATQSPKPQQPPPPATCGCDKDKDGIDDLLDPVIDIVDTVVPPLGGLLG